MGIGVAFFTEAVGAGPRRHMDMIGLGMNDGAALRDVTRPARRSSAISVQTQGQGHETTFAQIVAEELGHPARGRRRRPRRHRHDAVRPRHLRLALDAGQRRGDGAGRAQGARARADRRRGDARGRRPSDLEWANGPLGRSRATPSRAPRSRRSRWPRAGRSSCPTGVEARARRRGGLRPAEPDVPVRRLRLRRRRRPGHRRGQGAALRRGRRLRHAHQPDDRRGPDPRRADRRRRDGADGDDRVRRGGQLPRRVADGLPDPDRGRGARLGDGLHGHAVAAPPDRGQGDRRVGDRRLAAGDRQRDLRRARASGSATWTCRARRRGCGRRCEGGDA